MKVLLAGDWHSELHEEAISRALVQLGHDVVRFPWHQYFKPSGSIGKVAGAALKFQNKYLLGPQVNRVNRDLIALVAREKPDAVFTYRGTHVYPETLRRLRQVCSTATLIGYNNDDPFSPQYPHWAWRHFLAGVPEYDLVLAYRLGNLKDFAEAGAKRVRLLRSWYVPNCSRPMVLGEEDLQRFGCDVVFAGHYEDDGRLECLEEIVRRGWKLNLFGHDYGWHPVIRRSSYLHKLMPLQTVWGEDYTKALCGAKVALCFLSKLNRDTYTRRCFEIPACGTLMLAEHTEDLAGLFREGEEADFFRTPDQLVEKLAFYLGHEERRRSVAARGRRRVIEDGHDVVSRMRQVVTWVEELRESAVARS